VYFLTSGTNNGKRATRQIFEDTGNVGYSFHTQSDVLANTKEYSHSTAIYIEPDFLNSFFENGASKTGARLLGDTLFTYIYQLKKVSKSSSLKPKMRILLHGRSNNSRDIELYIGKDAASLRKVNSVRVNKFIGQLAEFEIEKTDIAANESFVFAVKSLNTLNEERFSIGFTEITYSQDVLMNGETSKAFTFLSDISGPKKVLLPDIKSEAAVYDISNQDEPKIISVKSGQFLIQGVKGKKSTIFVSENVETIKKTEILTTDFQKMTPASANYIIITNDLLFEDAKKYAAYRSSNLGGGYKTFVVNIKDLYNQFNYGETSPLAIRRFVEFMISDGNKDKYLFLFGKSITFVERMQPELAGDIPAIGYPGSDVLLIAGLGGEKTDVPVIPVGRLSAVTSQHAKNYLEKVMDYEQNVSDEYGWKKKVLHINGGKTSSEINSFKDFLSSLVPGIEKGTLGGLVTSFVKQGLDPTEQVNITPQVNEGVGMISYIGHGAQYITDLNFAYASVADRGYKNYAKYPLMYFNGCGVGNIFNARLNPNLSATDKIPLSLDWVVAEKKGAIAVIANSFNSYLSPTVRYLDALYKEMFVNVDSEKLPIGKIQRNTIKAILSEPSNYMDVANIHQSVLQGDPALHLIRVDKPDYAVDPEESILLYSKSNNIPIGSSDSVRVAITLFNNGKYNKADKLPVDINVFFKNGTKSTISLNVEAIPFADTVYSSIPLNNRQIQRLEVLVDPKSTLLELTKSNNEAELIVDWEVAQSKYLYPSESAKDIVAPILDVSFDSRLVKNNAVVQSDPLIAFIVTDDRIVNADTSYLNIYLKRCQDEKCDYEKLIYRNNSEVEIEQLSNHSFQLKYSSDLKAGHYELLAIASDKAGNSSEKPYIIKFDIIDKVDNNVQMVVSPNPASAFIRFEAKIGDVKLLESARLYIYDMKGVICENKEVKLSASNVTEWYWFPKTSGLYIYKVIFNGKDNNVQEITGKFVSTR
jgi:hypothetical protein